jgi:hypothetical protein
MAAKWADIPDPFLGKDLVKMFPLLSSAFLTMQLLDYNNGHDVILHGPCRYVIRKGEREFIEWKEYPLCQSYEILGCNL